MFIIREVAKSYRDHDGFSFAANISFFAVLSLIPLLMITMSVAGYVLGSASSVLSGVISAVTDVLPQGGDELASNLNGIIANRSRIGGAAIVVLLFIASLLFSSIERSMDRIFQSVKKRNFFHSRILSIILVFGMISLLFLPTMVNLFLAILAKLNISISLVAIVVSKALSVILLVFAFSAAVIIIPNHRVEPRYAVIGGVFFATGVAVAKFIFKWYLAYSFNRYNLIYGSLTVLVVTLLWIYYLANVLLITSELVAVLQRRYSSCQNGNNGNRV